MGLSNLMSGTWEGAFGYYLSWMVFDFGCWCSRGYCSAGSYLCSSLDFHGRVRVVRSMYLPAAIHGVQASLLASDSLRKLRSSIHRVVWSHRQPLAGVGAVFSLVGGPAGCDPAFVLCGFGFGHFVGILLFGPWKLVGFIVFWRWWVGVALVMVLSIFSLLVLLRLVLGGILMLWLDLGLVYFYLAIWLALFSISRLLFLMLG